MAAGRDAPCDPRDGEIGGWNLNEVQNDVISSGLPTPDSSGVCLRRQGGFTAKFAQALSARARRATNSRAAAIGDSGGQASRWISSTFRKLTPM